MVAASSDLPTQGTFESSGNAISGGYSGHSFTVEAIIIFITGLTLYNGLELLVMIFLTFTHFRGLYFWSLVLSAISLFPYTIGFLLKYLVITTGSARWAAITLLEIGWYVMITGQAVVLWSRLHLLVSGVEGERILKWTKWMIVFTVVVLQVPITILTYGSNANGTSAQAGFLRVYSAYEKVQMVGFFLQETILSTIYIIQAVRWLKTGLRSNTKKLLVQLFAVNVIIILMDIALVALEFANQYIWETEVKSAVYSIKLKLEFAVLSKLVFLGGNDMNAFDRRQASFVTDLEREKSNSLPDTANGAIDGIAYHIENASVSSRDGVPEFVDRSRMNSDVTHVPRHKRKGQDWEIARFEHLERISTLASGAESDLS